MNSKEERAADQLVINFLDWIEDQPTACRHGTVEQQLAVRKQLVARMNRLSKDAVARTLMQLYHAGALQAQQRAALLSRSRRGRPH